MRKSVAIVGSGPTAVYALQTLITSTEPLSISIYEAEAVAGKGTPYQRGINDPSMMSNIPGIEIPELPENLVDWLKHQSDDYLATFDVQRNEINDRDFYPRVVLGDFLHDQFKAIMGLAQKSRHIIHLREQCRVSDVAKVAETFCVQFEQGSQRQEETCDYVILATGHSFPVAPEVSPGFFAAPWPATALSTIPARRIGILGTSLSAIDAVMTIVTAFGSFRRDNIGRLEYVTVGENSSFSVVMMSRKGLLPEADYFFPLPYEVPKICTSGTVKAAIRCDSRGLLDAVFELFRQELFSADPDYAEAINLSGLTADTFADAYYGLRSGVDPFVWAQHNLDEAKRDYKAEHTVAWRYAILITHEIIEEAVRHFDVNDLARFNASFKSIFADDYATVPHISIERLLALHRSGHLSIKALGANACIDTTGRARGAAVQIDGEVEEFDTLIDATGQRSLSAGDFPFPSLVSQGIIGPLTTLTRHGNHRRTGSIEVDQKCRPVIAGIPSSRRLYLPAIAYLLHKRPFVQGITSAAELGEAVAAAVIAEVTRSSRIKRRYRATTRRREVALAPA